MTKAQAISKKWRNIISAIPVYDPFIDSGGFYFDEAEAQLRIDFIESECCHVEGKMSGHPYILQEHEKAIVANLFGWKDSAGLRRYRELFEYIPRKNSKTTFAACLALCVLFMDDEAGMQGYSTAADRDQASLIFRIASRMVAMNDRMSSLTTVTASSKNIALTDNSGFYRAISAEAATKHGYNTHLLLNDELHAHTSTELIDVLETSMGARTQPLEISITTADYMRESVCNSKYDYACKVRDGAISDARFLPVIYEMPKALLDADSEAWADPKNWALANPMLGKSVSLEFLERECATAKEDPSKQNRFMRLYLNLRTEQDIRWLPVDVWVKNNETFEDEELKGLRVNSGLDLSTKSDITALVHLFHPRDESDIWRLKAHFWIPADNLRDREERDKVPYSQWVREGLVTATPGNVIDYSSIAAQITRDVSAYDIQDIGCDPWSLEFLRQTIDPDGERIAEYPMNFKNFSEPMKQLEVILKNRKLAHNGNPVLKWMFSNIAIGTDENENIRPSKKHSTGRIDGIVALIMALGRAMVQEDTASVYETRDLLIL